MLNNQDIIVFDFETGGLSWETDEAIQIAGKAYNCRTLEPYSIEQGGEFCSLMKPLRPEGLKADALKVNKKTVEELMKAPDQKVIWNQFVAWVNKFNKENNGYGAPIAAGKNIRSFDLMFAAKLNQLHCPKKDKTLLFSNRLQLDLEDFLFHWFENEKEPVNYKMDTVRPYFGLSSEFGHDAMEDARQTGTLIMKFLKIYRELQKRKGKDGGRLIKFQNGN